MRVQRTEGSRRTRTARHGGHDPQSADGTSTGHDRSEPGATATGYGRHHSQTRRQAMNTQQPALSEREVVSAIGTLEAMRQRANRHEALLAKRDNLNRGIERLERQLNDSKSGLEALRTIQNVCGQVPSDLVTEGSTLFHGGMVARVLIEIATGQALGKLLRRRSEMEETLLRCREMLRENVEQLKEFEN
jgi:hypothetical protein